MKTGIKHEQEASLDIKRIQGLTDATFAVAMTLLILEVKIPHGLSTPEFKIYFKEHLLSDIFIYIIGFVTLGIFWIGSHFHHNIISTTDRISSWLNIIFLMIICIIPFCISLIRNYRNENISIIFYCSILIIASCINLLMISHAWKMNHTKSHYTLQHYNNARIRIVIPIGIYAMIIFVVFFSPTISLWLFLAPILLHIFPEKYSTSITPENNILS